MPDVNPTAETLAEAPTDFQKFEQWRNTGEVPAADAQPEAKAETAEDEGASIEQREKQERDDKGQFKPKLSPELQQVIDKRISKAVAKQREAERRAEDYERQLKEFQAPKPAAADDPEPDELSAAYSGQDGWKAYQRDTAQWAARQVLKAERAKETEDQQKQRYAEEGKKALESYRDSVAQVQAKYEDFDDALQEVADILLTPHLQGALMVSETKAELSYYLAKNRAELERVNQLPPHLVGYELGKLEAKLSPAKTSPKAASEVYTPPDLVGGTRAAATAPANPNDFNAWERKRNEELRKNGKRY